MTANPELMLHERLDAMVRERILKMRRPSDGSVAGVNHAIALDLLASLDAAEAIRIFCQVCPNCGAKSDKGDFPPMDEDACCICCGADCHIESVAEYAKEQQERADAAEARVKALTAELEEADKGLLFWRGIPAYTLDMTYDEAMSSKAVEAALARQKARAALKGESHD